MSDYLQNIFQAKQLTILSTAKEKLHTEMNNVAVTVNESSSLADQRKLENMQSNISTVSDYLKVKTSTASSKSSLQADLQNPTSNNLLSSMSSSSPLAQYLLAKS